MVGTTQSDSFSDGQSRKCIPTHTTGHTLVCSLVEPKVAMDRCCVSLDSRANILRVCSVM